jgi:hypothetical protein
MEINNTRVTRAAVAGLNNSWPDVVRVDLPELGRIDYDSARDRYRDRLSFLYLERFATVLEVLNVP